MSQASGSHQPELPLLLTPEQLAQIVFQLEYDERHIAHLRRHGHLPYVQFQIRGERVFRYPRDAVIQWITTRTHGQTKLMDPRSHGSGMQASRGRLAGPGAGMR